MVEFLGLLLLLVLVLASFTIMLGGRRLVRTLVAHMGKYFVVFLAAAILIAWLQSELDRASSPSRTLVVLLITLGVVLALVIAILPKFAKDLLSHVVGSFVYDVCKSAVKLAYGGILGMARLFKL